MLTDHDIYLFKEGSHGRLYEKLGCHPTESNGIAGARFAVWAPNARAVSVIGDWNDWDDAKHPLSTRGDGSGIWEGFVAGVSRGQAYKYRVFSAYRDYQVDKADPFACCAETPPSTASRAWRLDYQWQDDEWMRSRGARNALGAPMSIYEVHLGSWKRVPEDGNRSLSYRELAGPLAQYVRDLGFTHVEFLPVAEHPFYGSWGYQCTGYFAPTSRYGAPQDFMYLIDVLHQHDIGVILDWVPSHFPDDQFGLSYFDGTYLYEHADPKKGYHPHWHSYIFNYGRHEVRGFLLSSALYWLEKYHVDGLRVDAVASMLFLDYGRAAGEWIPNVHGGRENLEAVHFLRLLNQAVYREYPDAQVIAEESTAWPMVSRPVYLGGLGFGMKWNMGWMNDSLRYMALDPIYRRHHHETLTFSIWYAFSENFVLPLSHDEVVHGKGSLIGKMPGDRWQKFAHLRLLFGYMWSHPGRKLLFMGGEFGQWQEWNHEASLDWHLSGQGEHGGLQRWVSDLNRLYREEPALHDADVGPAGFEWIDCHDAENSVISFMRKSRNDSHIMLVICNFTPVPRSNYVLGVPRGGHWQEVLNSDAETYCGSGTGNMGGVEASPVPSHGHHHSVAVTLPPLATVYFRNVQQS
ncbi:MAG: 1,4-alpha-glucan branching protein GlgB [Chromatiales bacterium]